MTAAGKRTGAERERDQRAGKFTVSLRLELLWVSEALARAGYGHADDDSREAVTARAQAFFMDMIADAKGMSRAGHWEKPDTVD